MQAPLQAVWFVGHADAHAPRMQDPPDGQENPHRPQFAASLMRSTQASPHACWLALH
jgi:hypothetical protein